jgi:hypothetical protein
MEQIFKYPRTRHIEGSGLQADDEPITAPWADLAGRCLVVEEKMDGANCGVSFDGAGRLRLQSRGHELSGGPRERQFDLLKSWAAAHAAGLWDLLGDRYVMYGEWCYGKHSIFYTDLPHYFLEFDMLDTWTGAFLSTEQRTGMLRDISFITSVRVLHTGALPSIEALLALIGPSRFIAHDQRDQLIAAARNAGIDAQQALAESDTSGLMEGLYIKVEDTTGVLARYKYVRRSFLQTVLDSGSHWMDRPLLPNRLRDGVRLW